MPNAIEKPSEQRTPPSHTKATRQDWLRAAKSILIEEGAERVKILPLAERLNVSRSSFYWYFKDRRDLLGALLDFWGETNTRAIVDQANRPADNIFEAINNIFECWVDEALFDPGLDFAVREWSRRSEKVRAVVDKADEARVTALARMFEGHGYVPRDAFIRARVLYFMQIGYYALDLGESIETRMLYIGDYLRSFSGKEPPSEDVARFVERLSNRERP